MTDKNPLAHYSGVLTEAVQESAGVNVPAFGAAALSEYLKTCEQQAIVPDVGGAFAFAFAAGFNLAASQATLPKSDYLEGVNIPNLREALIFLGRENGVGEGEVGDKLAEYVNSVVSGVLSKKATLREADQAAPAAVAKPDEAQIKALMRKHRIWIEHSTLFEDDEPPRELRAVQAEQHQFESFVQDLIARAAIPAADAQAKCAKCHTLEGLGINIRSCAKATPVVLPEPDAVISEVMELVKDWAQRDLIAAEAGIDTLSEESSDKQHQEAKRLDGEAETAYRAIESKLRALLATATGLPPQAVPLLTRATQLHEKGFMPWTEAEELALSEAGIGDSEIDELIGNCQKTTVQTLLDAEDLRVFVRAILVHQPATTTAAAPQAQADARDAGINHGVCLALQVMAAAGNAGSAEWSELLDAAGRAEVTHYAQHIEPDNWELCGFAELERRRIELEAIAAQDADRAAIAAAKGE